MIKYDPEAAERLKNSRLMKPVKTVWAILAVSAASALAGLIGFTISGNPKVFFAWLLCIPFFFIVMPLFIRITNAITGALISFGSAPRRRKREEPNKTPEHISEGRGRPSENAQR